MTSADPSPVDGPSDSAAVAAEAATRSMRRLRLLAQVARLVDAPLDLQVTLQQVADLAIEELADWCAVDLDPRLDGGTGDVLVPVAAEPDGPVEPSGAQGIPGERGSGEDARPKLVAVAHKDPAMVTLALELQEKYPPPAHDPDRERLLSDLTPIHLPVVTDEMLVAGSRDEQHLAILRGLGMSSAVAVPLQVAGRGFGVMLLVAAGGRRLDDDDVELAVELGRRAGAAVDKVRLANRLAHTARELALSEERYRTLVRAGSLAVWRAAPDGTTLTDMPAWRRITGGAGTQGWGWVDDVYPPEQSRIRQAWLHAVATGEQYEQTYRIREVGGGWRWVTARAVPVRQDRTDPSSPIVEWIGSVTDVTAEVLARTRTQALLACAEALARAIDASAVMDSLHQVAAASLDASSVVVAWGDRLGPPVLRHPARVPERHRRRRRDERRWSRMIVDASRLRRWPSLRRVIDSGEPEFVNEPATAGPAPGRDVAWAALPLIYGGEVVAAVRFGWTEPQDFDAAFRWTLQAMASQHAAALIRARLYEAERATSLMLQAALAPDVRRRVGDVEIGVHYRPAGVQAQVGGDWADAFPLVDGRVVLAVGDVMGSGIPAAATMGRLRTMLSTLALHELDPARLLVDLDRVLFDAPGDLLATVALAVIDTDGSRMSVYSAGHLPALVSSPAGDPFLAEAARIPPLGVGWHALGGLPGARTVELPPGSVVALCSDGLLETRDADIDQRLDTWRSAVRDCSPIGDLDVAAQSIVRHLAPSPDDDVTLLLGRHGNAVSGRQRILTSDRAGLLPS